MNLAHYLNQKIHERIQTKFLPSTEEEEVKSVFDTIDEDLIKAGRSQPGQPYDITNDPNAGQRRTQFTWFELAKQLKDLGIFYIGAERQTPLSGKELAKTVVSDLKWDANKINNYIIYGESMNLVNLEAQDDFLIKSKFIEVIKKNESIKGKYEQSQKEAEIAKAEKSRAQQSGSHLAYAGQARKGGIQTPVQYSQGEGAA